MQSSISPMGVFRCLVVDHQTCHRLYSQQSIPADSATTAKHMPVLNLKVRMDTLNDDWLIGIAVHLQPRQQVQRTSRENISIQCARYVHALLIWLKKRFERSKNMNVWEIQSMSSLASWACQAQPFGCAWKGSMRVWNALRIIIVPWPITGKSKATCVQNK